LAWNWLENQPFYADLCFQSLLNFALSHNALRLAAAVAEARSLAQNSEATAPPQPLPIVETLALAKDTYLGQANLHPPPTEPTFEMLFKRSPPA
jgi:hypothetical protein